MTERRKPVRFEYYLVDNGKLLRKEPRQMYPQEAGKGNAVFTRRGDTYRWLRLNIVAALQLQRELERKKELE